LSKLLKHILEFEIYTNRVYIKYLHNNNKRINKNNL
jgi:hypothetical protein